MRILVDLQGAQGESRGRGIGRYATSLSRALIAESRKSGEHEFIFLVNSGFPRTVGAALSELGELGSHEKVVIFHGATPSKSCSPENSWRKVGAEVLYEELVQNINPDVFLIPSLFEGWKDNCVVSIPDGGYPFLTAVIHHDLIPLVHADSYLKDLDMRSWYMGQLDRLNRADLILTVSSASRLELISTIGAEEEQVATIGAGAERNFFEQKAISEVVTTKFGITKPYLMHTSAFDDHKNFDGLIRAFAGLPQKLRDGHQLVLVGRNSEAKNSALRCLCEEVGLSASNVIMTGYVTDADLASLYRNSALFIFPSFLEGFGLPVVEAMACGAPVIASDIPSVRDIVNYEGALFKPSDTGEITTLIQKALEDPLFRQQLARNGAHQAQRFHWDDIARRCLGALSSSFGRRNPGERDAVQSRYIDDVIKETDQRVPGRAASDYSSIAILAQSMLSNEVAAEGLLDRGYPTAA